VWMPAAACAGPSVVLQPEAAVTSLPSLPVKGQTHPGAVQTCVEACVSACCQIILKTSLRLRLLTWEEALQQGSTFVLLFLVSLSSPSRQGLAEHTMLDE